MVAVLTFFSFDRTCCRRLVGYGSFFSRLEITCAQDKNALVFPLTSGCVVVVVVVVVVVGHVDVDEQKQTRGGSVR